MGDVKKNLGKIIDDQVGYRNPITPAYVQSVNADGTINPVIPGNSAPMSGVVAPSGLGANVGDSVVTAYSDQDKNQPFIIGNAPGVVTGVSPFTINPSPDFNWWNTLTVNSSPSNTYKTSGKILESAHGLESISTGANSFSLHQTFQVPAANILTFKTIIASYQSKFLLNGKSGPVLYDTSTGTTTVIIITGSFTPDYSWMDSSGIFIVSYYNPGQFQFILHRFDLSGNLVWKTAVYSSQYNSYPINLKVVSSSVLVIHATQFSKFFAAVYDYTTGSQVTAFNTDFSASVELANNGTMQAVAMNTLKDGYAYSVTSSVKQGTSYPALIYHADNVNVAQNSQFTTSVPICQKPAPQIMLNNGQILDPSNYTVTYWNGVNGIVAIHPDAVIPSGTGTNSHLEYYEKAATPANVTLYNGNIYTINVTTQGITGANTLLLSGNMIGSGSPVNIFQDGGFTVTSGWESENGLTSYFGGTVSFVASVVQGLDSSGNPTGQYAVTGQPTNLFCSIVGSGTSDSVTVTEISGWETQFARVQNLGYSIYIQIGNTSNPYNLLTIVGGFGTGQALILVDQQDASGTYYQTILQLVDGATGKSSWSTVVGTVYQPDGAHIITQSVNEVTWYSDKYVAVWISNYSSSNVYLGDSMIFINTADGTIKKTIPLPGGTAATFIGCFGYATGDFILAYLDASSNLNLAWYV